MIHIYGLRQGDLTKYSTLAEFAEMHGPCSIAVLMSGFSFNNYRVWERCDSDVFGVESRQSKLQLKLIFVFGEFHVGNLEYLPFCLKPVTHVIARIAPSFLE